MVFIQPLTTKFTSKTNTVKFKKTIKIMIANKQPDPEEEYEDFETDEDFGGEDFCDEEDD